MLLCKLLVCGMWHRYHIPNSIWNYLWHWARGGIQRHISSPTWGDTITLEDIALIFGLRVHDEAVTIKNDAKENIVGACVELLRLHLPADCKDFVQRIQLRQKFVEAQSTAKQDGKRNILIITTKNNNVSPIHLSLLRNL